MRAHSRPVRSTRPNGRRLAGAVLAAAALLAAAGCSGDTKAAPPQTGKAVADVSSTIAGLKVCELTSLTPLVKVLGSPGYKDGPADVQKGSGVDPGGPQCAAQLKLPPLANVTGQKEELVPARLNIAVVPYSDKAQADASFASRLADQEGLGADGGEAGGEEGAEGGGVAGGYLGPDLRTDGNERADRAGEPPPVTLAAGVLGYFECAFLPPAQSAPGEHQRAVRVGVGADVVAVPLGPPDPRVVVIRQLSQYAGQLRALGRIRQRRRQQERVDPVHLAPGQLLERVQERRVERRGDIVQVEVLGNPLGRHVGGDHEVAGQTQDTGVPLGRSRDDADGEIRGGEDAAFDAPQNVSQGCPHTSF